MKQNDSKGSPNRMERSSKTPNKMKRRSISIKSKKSPKRSEYSISKDIISV